MLELATVLAGPGAGRLLADLGADVVKVEHPDRPDPTRAMGFPAPDGGPSLLWRITARNKVLRTADLKTDGGLEAVLALARFVRDWDIDVIDAEAVQPLAAVTMRPRDAMMARLTQRQSA